MALPQYQYTWRGHTEVACRVLQAHPILGNSRQGDVFQLRSPDGYCSGTGLPQDATILLDTPADYPETFPVLYVRNHGQGRVVRAQWHRPHQPGIPLPGFTFYVRCINWAAGRDADAVW